MTDKNGGLKEDKRLDEWLQWKRGLELQGDWIIGTNHSPEWIPINLSPSRDTALDDLLSGVTVEETHND